MQIGGSFELCIIIFQFQGDNSVARYNRRHIGYDCMGIRLSGRRKSEKCNMVIQYENTK